ncbi:uncharacterized protein LOC143922560 isoform X1 [Arctopsyche grandis]|uniref:uncharacterized protein LOC143922560 isoform X1 n=1 Tax=Arctopsyche grandis TaxID=121162 RepID=UPI00406D7033
MSCLHGGRSRPFATISNTTPDADLAGMLITLTGLQVSEDDGLPCQLCTQCATKLDDAVSFKNLCEKSDSLFRQYVTEKIPDTLNNHAYIKQEMSAENPYEVANMEISGDYDDFLIFKTEPEVQLNEAKPVFKLDDVKEEMDISVKDGKNYYSCGICSKSYTGAKSLKRHMAVHTGDGFKCNQCTKIFARRDHLRKHLQRVHSIKNIDVVMNTISLKTAIKYDCPYCGVDATNKILMGRHLRSCHKDKLPRRKNSALNYQDFLNASISSDDDDDDSKTIGLVTTSGGGAVAKIKEEKPLIADGESQLVLEVLYECKTCNTQYDNQHSYAAHMTKHSEPIPKGQTDFRCSKCDKVFTKRKNLKQHLLTHNEEKANKCTLCHRAFTRPDQLILHMNNHTGKKRHQCSHCDKGFNMLSTLKDHLRTHSGEKPYLCSICGKGFTQNTNLKQHLMRHSATKPFSCPTCHAKFVSKGELDAHLRKHTGDHPFVCDICGTGFTTSSSLVKHKRIHSGERPYACDLCCLRFTALGTLKNHRRTHTGEKPFACTYCTRAFAQKSDLVSHTRTHTGERPYVCATCGAQYQQSSALKAHIKNSHHSLVTKLTTNPNIERHQLTIDGDKKICVTFEIPPLHFSMLYSNMILTKGTFSRAVLLPVDGISVSPVCISSKSAFLCYISHVKSDSIVRTGSIHTDCVDVP